MSQTKEFNPSFIARLGSALKLVLKAADEVKAIEDTEGEVGAYASAFRLRRILRTWRNEEIAKFMSEDDSFRRAGGACVCETCGDTYDRHPTAVGAPDPTIQRLCDGTLIKT